MACKINNVVIVVIQVLFESYYVKAYGYQYYMIYVSCSFIQNKRKLIYFRYESLLKSRFVLMNYVMAVNHMIQIYGRNLCL